MHTLQGLYEVHFCFHHVLTCIALLLHSKLLPSSMLYYFYINTKHKDVCVFLCSTINFVYLKHYIQSWLFPEQISATVIGVEMRVCVVIICLFGTAMADSCPTWFTNTTGSCECGTEMNGNVNCHQETLRVDMMLGRCMTLFNNISVVVGFCQHAFASNITSRVYSSVPDGPAQLDSHFLCSLQSQRFTLWRMY